MATINAAGGDFIIDGANTYIIGEGADTLASNIVVHLVSASFSGTVTVKKRSNAPSAIANNIAFLGTPYLKEHLNGSAADQTYVTTAITDTSLIVIPATGGQIALVSTFVSGSMHCYVTRVEGAAA